MACAQDWLNFFLEFVHKIFVLAFVKSNIELGDLRIGIWGYSVEGSMIASGDECFKYASDDTDMYIDCVKVLGLIAIALGGIAAVSWYE